MEGDWADKDPDLAIQQWKSAAEKHISQAQYNLFVCYTNGLGVTAQNETANFWLEAAADQQHPLAQFHLGRNFYQGKHRNQDFKKALYWYIQAAENRVVDAQMDVGVLYYTGQGIDQNIPEGYAWAKIAAEQGDQKHQQTFDYMKQKLKTKPELITLGEQRYSELKKALRD